MKIPKNMTEQQVIDQINIVINRIAPKYSFGTYGIDDIKQESFIICMDALERYDQKRPLENFLSVHLSNRLKNFIRDNYYTKDEEQKKRVLKPKYISTEDVVEYDTNNEQKYDSKHLSRIVDKYLPHQYRADYLKMINDVYVSKKRKEEILSIIKQIVETRSNEKG